MTDQTVMTLRFQSVFFCSHGSKRRISAFALWSEQNSLFIPLVTTKTWLELEPMLVISRTLVSLEKQNSFVCTNSCQFGYQNHFWGAGLYKTSRNWRRLTTRGEGAPLYKPYRCVLNNSFVYSYRHFKARYLSQWKAAFHWWLNCISSQFFETELAVIWVKRVKREVFWAR